MGFMDIFREKKGPEQGGITIGDQVNIDALEEQREMLEKEKKKKELEKEKKEAEESNFEETLVSPPEDIKMEDFEKKE